MVLWRASRAGLIALSASGLALLGSIGVDAVSAQASYEVQPREPQYLYDRTCGYCHGHNVGPILLGRELSPQIVSYFVRNGNGAMPAFKPTEITDTELEALAAWIAASETDETEHGQ